LPLIATPEAIEADTSPLRTAQTVACVRSLTLVGMTKVFVLLGVVFVAALFFAKRGEK
jgi:hypothetical protein